MIETTHAYSQALLTEVGAKAAERAFSGENAGHYLVNIFEEGNFLGVVVTRQGSGYKKAMGVAKRNPNDKMDLHIGLSVAMGRAFRSLAKVM